MRFSDSMKNLVADLITQVLRNAISIYQRQSRLCLGLKYLYTLGV